MQQLVVGVGGANVDIHGRSDAPILMRDSNPGILHLSAGGVCRNICDNLCRLGVPVSFVGAVGDDHFGSVLLDSCRAVGMDVSHTRVFPGERSGSYISIMDDAGDMLVGMSDMSILGRMGPEFAAELRPLLAQASVCVTDTNLPTETLAALADACDAPVFIDPVSCAKAKKLVPVLGKFHTIKPNRMEMEILAGCNIPDLFALDAACDAVLAQGVQRLFVSLGADGLFYKDASGISLHEKSRPFPMTNATGAGDAALAGLVYAWLQGMPPKETLQFAIGASLVAIDCADTIHPAMSPALVQQYSKEYVS